MRSLWRPAAATTGGSFTGTRGRNDGNMMKELLSEGCWYPDVLHRVFVNPQLCRDEEHHSCLMKQVRLKRYSPSVCYCVQLAVNSQLTNQSKAMKAAFTTSSSFSRFHSAPPELVQSHVSPTSGFRTPISGTLPENKKRRRVRLKLGLTF